MSRSRGVYVAAAPILLFLLLTVGIRFMPTASGGPANTVPEAARPGPPPHPMSIADRIAQKQMEAAVGGQIMALRKEDYPKALTFSAPDFQRAVTVSTFRNMIEIRFAPITVSRSQNFAPAESTGTEAVLPAILTAPDGSTSRYLYGMVKVNDGWYVASCSPMEPPAKARTARPVKAEIDDIREL